MPRMSKKRKQEWALFLNERNRITYNGLCRKCSNECKQSFRCIITLNFNGLTVGQKLGYLSKLKYLSSV